MKLHGRSEMREYLEKSLLNQAAASEVTCACKSADASSNCILPDKENVLRSRRSNPIDFLCIPCKRFKRQKEKEAWFSTPPESNADTKSLPEVCSDPQTQSTTEETASNEDLEALLTAANKVLLSRLECPVCLQFMTPPLKQCQNGHSVCCSCHKKLRHCPSCRRNFIETSNVILNELCLIVLVPCRNYSSGCRQLVRLLDKVEHEKQCQWTQYDCPVQAKDCFWKGTQKNVVQHVVEIHSDTVSRVQLGRQSSLRYTYGPIHPAEEIGPETDNFNIISRVLVLVDADGDGRGVFVFTIKYDTADGSLCGMLRYVGSKQEANNYSYKAKLISPDDTFKVATTTLAVPYAEDMDNVFNSGKVMKLDGCAFKTIVDGQGKFFISIKIVLRGLEDEV